MEKEKTYAEWLEKKSLDVWNDFVHSTTMREGLKISSVGMDMISDIIYSPEVFDKLKPTERTIILASLGFAKAGIINMSNSPVFKKMANKSCAELLNDWKHHCQSSATEPKQEPHLSEA